MNILPVFPRSCPQITRKSCGKRRTHVGRMPVVLSRERVGAAALRVGRAAGARQADLMISAMMTSGSAPSFTMPWEPPSSHHSTSPAATWYVSPLSVYDPVPETM